MGSSLIAALGLVLVIEGLLPLATPRGWRTTMQRLTTLRDGQIRFVGLLSMVAGAVLVTLAR